MIAKDKGLVSVLLVALAGAAGASADSRDVMCATVEVTECVSGELCGATTSVATAVPPFLRVDLEKGVITGKRASGEDLVTEILHTTRIEDGVILQGVDDTLGWTMTLSEVDGSMSLAVSGDLVGYVIFGNCTVL